jgi:hypothetical protein
VRAQQTAAAAAPARKRERKVFTIDFVGGEALSARKLFGTKATAATMNLPASEAGVPTLLPDDLRIVPADLARLFLKPLWQARLQQTARGPGTLVEGTAAPLPPAADMPAPEDGTCCAVPRHATRPCVGVGVPPWLTALCAHHHQARSM